MIRKLGKSFALTCASEVLRFINDVRVMLPLGGR
jgi:hypothetical protein